MLTREFLNSVVLVPLIIIISWQFPLWSEKHAGDVTVITRVCYELFGTCAEAQYQPPLVIVGFCARNLPKNVTLEIAKDVSSIVGIHRHVVKNLYRFKYDSGYSVLGYLTEGLFFNGKELCRLLDAANWVRMMPSMFLGSNQLRGGFLTLYFTSLLYKIPVPFEQLGLATHIVAALVLIDFVWLILDERPVSDESAKAAGAPLWRRTLRITGKRWRILRIELLNLSFQVIVPLVLVVFTASFMLLVAFLVDKAHGLIPPG